MTKFRTTKGGGLMVVAQEEDAREPAGEIERHKPLAAAITEEWEPFPTVDAGLDPTGPFVVVQKRMPRTRIGSIITSADSRDVDGWNERVGKLVAVGPGCFKDVTGAPAFGVVDGWPKPGDLVRMPSHGGDEMTRTSMCGRHKVTLKMFHWRDLTGIVRDESL